MPKYHGPKDKTAEVWDIDPTIFTLRVDLWGLVAVCHYSHEDNKVKLEAF